MAEEELPVILVPPDRARVFLLEDKIDAIRVQAEDGDTWMVPKMKTKEMLMRFLLMSEKDIDLKFCQMGPGVRIGFDHLGVYIQENHLKRYYGIERHSAGIALSQAMPEAVPMQHSAGAHHCSNSRLLRGMLEKIPNVSEDVRGQILQATFKSVDLNGNGYVDKSEMVTMMRKIMPTMSGKQVVELMRDADTNKNGEIDYEEFLAWLKNSAPEEIKDALTRNTQNECDCVKAAFRVWDKSGDGLISMKELKAVLRKSCPQLSPAQIQSLAMFMDGDKNGMIDYEEFCSFLFAGKPM